MEQPGFDTLVKEDASTDDTLQLIVDYVNQHSCTGFARDVADKFANEDKHKFLHDVFDYYCRNVDYLLDPEGIEKVYTPARTISEGRADCKKAAVFLGCVLKSAGIEPVLKHVTYKGNDKFTHIYIIVPDPDLSNYITLDPTNDCKYNSEVSYHVGTLYFLNGKKMELHGMGNSDDGSSKVSSPGWGSQFIEETISGFEDLGENLPLIGRGGRGRRQERKAKRHDAKTHRQDTRHSNRQKRLDNKSQNLDQSQDNSQDNSQPAQDSSTFTDDNDAQSDSSASDDQTASDDTQMDPGDDSAMSGAEKIVADMKKLASVLPPHKIDKIHALQNIPLEQQRGAFLELVRNNVNGIANDLGAVLGTNLTGLNKIWQPLGGNIDVLKQAILEGANLSPQKVSGTEDEEFIGAKAKKKFNLANFLHGAAGILHAIAPISNAILPGAGVALNGLGNKADFIQDRFPSKDKNGKLNPPPPIPYDNRLPPGFHATGGSVMGSIGGFIFKTSLLISILHINPTAKSILETVAIVAPLIYFTCTKIKSWTLTHI